MLLRAVAILTPIFGDRQKLASCEEVVMSFLMHLLEKQLLGALCDIQKIPFSFDALKKKGEVISDIINTRSKKNSLDISKKHSRNAVWK